MVRRSLVVVSLALAAPALTRAEAPPTGEAARIEAQVRQMLNASGPRLDACVARHAEEYPSVDGRATIVATVKQDGSVLSARVETALEGARNLRFCLEQAAKTWRFPEANAATVEVKIQVPVKKGANFRLPAPGEKRTERVEQAKDGFLFFMPGEWKSDPSVANLPDDDGR
jgi:hypothetical protein